MIIRIDGPEEKPKEEEPCCCGDDAATMEGERAKEKVAESKERFEQTDDPKKEKKKHKKGKKGEKGKKKDKDKGKGKRDEVSEEEPCCCSGVDSESSYSSEDDPYQGCKKNIIVDFLFLDLSCCDRCQGADERVALAVERCRPVLAACGYNLVLNQIYVDTPQLAERYRFESSPTVRVNGVDICPSIEENDCACCSDISGTDVKCRVFPFNGTYYEVPPTDMLVRGIMEVTMGGKLPPAEQEPYVMPENLREFYAGVKRKAKAAGKSSGASASKGSCCC